MSSTILREGQIITSEHIITGDVYIEDGKIAEIAPSITRSADQEFDCRGLQIFPGMIDTHVHFRDAGLGWVPFHIRPHLNSKWFPQVKVPYIEAQAKELQEPVYAIDDQSAVVVTGHGIEQKASVVSEGEWKLIDP